MSLTERKPNNVAFLAEMSDGNLISSHTAEVRLQWGRVLFFLFQLHHNVAMKLTGSSVLLPGFNTHYVA